MQVPFTVEVPENATPGDYAGGIVTSLVEPDATQGINVDAASESGSPSASVGI